MKNILRSMKLWQKFAALGVIGAVMTAVPTIKVVEYKTAEAAVAESEDAGLDPARTAIAMMRSLQQHRGLSGIALNGSAAADGERRALRQEVGKSMDLLLKQVQDLGYKVSANDVQSLKAEWEKLGTQVDTKSISPAESFSAHSQLIDHTLRSIESMADASGLSLDPVAETYFVMTAAVDHLPRLTEAMARLRGLGAAMLSAKEISAQERARLAHLAEQSHYLLDRASAQFAKASEIRPSMKKALDGVTAAHDEATKFFTLAEKELMGSAKPTLAAADFFRAGTAAVDAQYQLIEVANHTLEEALHERIHDTNQARTMLLALLGGLTLVAAGLGIAITRSVTRPLGHAVDAANAVAAGNLEFAIDSSGQDEAARLLGRFTEMQTQLRQRRADDEQRRADAEAAALAATQVAEEIGDAVDGATQGDFTRRIAT
ncbi:MAG: nitrate- and nitrite sensing domain-containing protein, partial [Rubrivivax sp.]|nr:nitrate- and nitrite sensing domain-containing protein [Rubrivivax sp.]